MNRLIEQVELEKQRLKSLCSFKKGDILEWHTLNKEGISVIHRGIFDYIYVNDKLETHIKINLPVSHRLNFSSSYAYILNPEYSEFKVIDNPCSIDKLNRLRDIIDAKEYEIRKMTKLLRLQKEKLEKYYQQEQDKCVHNWNKIGGHLAAPIRAISYYSDNLLDVYEWECTLCGKTIEST